MPSAACRLHSTERESYNKNKAGASLKQLRVIVRGKVQGVGFRASTFREAQKYPELHGYVQNLEDGSVEAVFSGRENEVLAMVSWCQIGPRAAQVDRVEVKEEAFDPSLGKFEIGL